MTWNELRDFCNNLTADQLEKEVVLIQEETAITKIKADVHTEDYYYESKYPYEGSVPESEIDFEDDVERSIAWRKGDVFLYENLNH